MSRLVSWLWFPLYVWQAVGVRRSIERLLPAQGPVDGEFEGETPGFRLLIVGDSSAASVGIDNSDRGVAAQLAALLSERTGRAVLWRAAGFNSATAGQLRDFVVPNLAPVEWTHIVVSVGTNDMKNMHTLGRFKREFGGLAYALKAKWPHARIIWSPVVDMTLVPALPNALGRYLEGRTQRFNALGEQLCRERGLVAATRLPISDPALGFARDGFHASQAGYRAWSEHLMPFVLGDG